MILRTSLSGCTCVRACIVKGQCHDTCSDFLQHNILKVCRCACARARVCVQRIYDHPVCARSTYERTCACVHDQVREWVNKANLMVKTN